MKILKNSIEDDVNATTAVVCSISYRTTTIDEIKKWIIINATIEHVDFSTNI